MKVTFIIADCHGTRVAAMYEKEDVPYRRRTVTIELTPAQLAAVELRQVGQIAGDVVYEEVLDCFLENEARL